MNDNGGKAGEKPASDILSDQSAQSIGQRILDTLVAAGFATASAQRRGVAPAELGRLAWAFANIEDAGVRNECLSLVEAISGSPIR
jgi:hypothetical protein